MARWQRRQLFEPAVFGAPHAHVVPLFWCQYQARRLIVCVSSGVHGCVTVSQGAHRVAVYSAYRLNLQPHRSQYRATMTGWGAWWGTA